MNVDSSYSLDAGTFFQSLRNAASPVSVRGCLNIFSITAYGNVATSAPDFAASTTCKGCLTLATIISVRK